MYTTKQKGFTIVELLIVIVVIAILAAISIVAFTGIQQRGRDSERASDVSNIVTAITALGTDGQGYPEADDVADAIEAHGIANIPSEVTDKLVEVTTDPETSEPSNVVSPAKADDTTYGYFLCGSGSSATGAKITWVREANGAYETTTAGSCS